MEKDSLIKNHKLSTLQSIYHQLPEFRDIQANKRSKRAPPLSPEPTAPSFSPSQSLPSPPPYSLFVRKDASISTATTPGEQVMSEIERVIEKEKTETEEVIPDDPFYNILKG